MSDQHAPAPEQPMPPPQQPSQPPAAPAQPSAIATLISAMSRWEQLTVAGALVIVLGDLLFGIILREFYAGDLLWIAAAVALVAFAANRRATVPLYFNLMLLAGGIVALLGARELVIELLFILRNFADVSAVYLIGFIVWTAGLVLMAWGAWLTWNSRDA